MLYRHVDHSLATLTFLPAGWSFAKMWRSEVVSCCLLLMPKEMICCCLRLDHLPLFMIFSFFLASVSQLLQWAALWGGGVLSEHKCSAAPRQSRLPLFKNLSVSGSDLTCFLFFVVFLSSSSCLRLPLSLFSVYTLSLHLQSDTLPAPPLFSLCEDGEYDECLIESHREPLPPPSCGCSLHPPHAVLSLSVCVRWLCCNNLICGSPPKKKKKEWLGLIVSSDSDIPLVTFSALKKVPPPPPEHPPAFFYTSSPTISHLLSLFIV